MRRDQFDTPRSFHRNSETRNLKRVYRLCLLLWKVCPTATSSGHLLFPLTTDSTTDHLSSTSPRHVWWLFPCRLFTPTTTTPSSTSVSRDLLRFNRPRRKPVLSVGSWYTGGSDCCLSATTRTSTDTRPGFQVILDLNGRRGT